MSTSRPVPRLPWVATRNLQLRRSIPPGDPARFGDCAALSIDLMACKFFLRRTATLLSWAILLPLIEGEKWHCLRIQKSANVLHSLPGATPPNHVSEHSHPGCAQRRQDACSPQLFDGQGGDLADGDAAVNEDGLAGDVGGGVRGEEEEGAVEVAGLAGAT